MLIKKEVLTSFYAAGPVGPVGPVDACIDAHIAYMKFVEDIDIEAKLENYNAMMEWIN